MREIGEQAAERGLRHRWDGCASAGDRVLDTPDPDGGQAILAGQDDTGPCDVGQV